LLLKLAEFTLRMQHYIWDCLTYDCIPSGWMGGNLRLISGWYRVIKAWALCLKVGQLQRTILVPEVGLYHTASRFIISILCLPVSFGFWLVSKRILLHRNLTISIHFSSSQIDNYL
jgi:hypothetical protein